MMDNDQKRGTIAAKRFPEQPDLGRLPAALIDDLYAELYVYVDADYRVEIPRRGQQWHLTLGDRETCAYRLDLHGDRLAATCVGAPLGISLFAAGSAASKPRTEFARGTVGPPPNIG